MQSEVAVPSKIFDFSTSCSTENESSGSMKSKATLDVESYRALIHEESRCLEEGNPAAREESEDSCSLYKHTLKMQSENGDIKNAVQNNLQSSATKNCAIKGSVNNHTCDNDFSNVVSQGSIFHKKSTDSKEDYSAPKITFNDNGKGLPETTFNSRNLLSSTRPSFSDELKNNSELHSPVPAATMLGSSSETRLKQRRKSRKPLKSSVRYIQAQPSPSPPPTLPSPPPPLQLPLTPPSSLQPPLSPPLSDVQSSLSSLSPCSSVNSEEAIKSTKGPVPKLLPISISGKSVNHHSSLPLQNYISTSNNNTCDEFIKRINSPHESLKSAEPGDSSNDFDPSDSELPPPPPYPKNKLPASVGSKKVSNGDESKPEFLIDSSGQLNESDDRPPPPPYHSHVFSGKSSKKRSASDAEDEGSVPGNSEQSPFWPSVTLPPSLSVSPVISTSSACSAENGNESKVSLSAPRISCDEKDGRTLSKSIKKDDHGEASPESVNAVTMLLQRIAAARSSNAPSSCPDEEHNLSKEVSGR